MYSLAGSEARMAGVTRAYAEMMVELKAIPLSAVVVNTTAHVEVLTMFVDRAVSYVTGRRVQGTLKFEDLPLGDSKNVKGRSVVDYGRDTVDVEIYRIRGEALTLDQVLGVYAHKVAPIMLSPADAATTDVRLLLHNSVVYYDMAWQCVYMIDEPVAMGSHRNFLETAKAKLKRFV